MKMLQRRPTDLPSTPILAPIDNVSSAASVLAARPQQYQQALLLRAPKLRYELVRSHPVPRLEQDDEVLIQIHAISLNPIDWKSADYGFGLPTLPAVNGRDLAGTIVQVGPRVQRLRVGDRVWGPSTQYRDYRTSAFQQFAIARESGLGKVPRSVSLEQCAALGVGTVTAALALGSALGAAIGEFAPRDLAIGAEGEETIDELPVAKKGDWLLIWGASTVTGYFACQFARLAGLQVVAVADVARHSDRLAAIGIHDVVDRRLDPATVVSQIYSITKGSLRFALDCVSRPTAEMAASTLVGENSVLVGLAGLPKSSPANVQLREVPVKTFHTNAAVGRAIMTLVEDLIERQELVLPPVEVVFGGLEAINGALDRLRTGDVPFGRLVVQT